jgi:hypothetical protein
MELLIMVLSRGGAENILKRDPRKVMNHIGAHNVCQSSMVGATCQIDWEDHS